MNKKLYNAYKERKKEKDMIVKKHEDSYMNKPYRPNGTEDVYDNYLEYFNKVIKPDIERKTEEASYFENKLYLDIIKTEASFKYLFIHEKKWSLFVPDDEIQKMINKI